MDIRDIAEKAVGFKRNGCNCAQAVAVALSSETEIPEETLRQMTAGFGGGMGTMEGACGSLVAAGMIAGLHTKGAQTMKYSRQICSLFREKSGAVTCKTLKGIETGKVLCPCDDCVRNAVLSYGEVLGLSEAAEK